MIGYKIANKKQLLCVYLFTSPYLFRFLTCALLSDPDGNIRTLLQSVFTNVTSVYANLLKQKKAFA